jgi:hypothetical protein
VWQSLMLRETSGADLIQADQAGEISIPRLGSISDVAFRDIVAKSENGIFISGEDISLIDEIVLEVVSLIHGLARACLPACLNGQLAGSLCGLCHLGGSCAIVMS